MLTIMDEYTRECLSIDVARKLNHDDVLDRLAWLMATRGVPEHIRSDNGSEFTAKVVREWLSRLGVRTLYIEPGSPWENGYCESFNAKLRDELLTGEIFYTLAGRRSSSNPGGPTTIRNARTHRWATARQPPRSRSGRLRHPAQLRRPHRP